MRSTPTRARCVCSRRPTSAWPSRWPRDCVKVTTPVHVVDKSTKLETLHDRIHEVDTRWEVVKRDALVRQWQAIAQGAEVLQAQAQCAAFCAQCDADRDFLRRANVGGERMADADMERVRQIGRSYRWQTPSGKEAPLLSDEELNNLTVRAGTLNAERNSARRFAC